MRSGNDNRDFIFNSITHYRESSKDKIQTFKATGAKNIT